MIGSRFVAQEGKRSVLLREAGYLRQYRGESFDEIRLFVIGRLHRQGLLPSVNIYNTTESIQIARVVASLEICGSFQMAGNSWAVSRYGAKRPGMARLTAEAISREKTEPAFLSSHARYDLNTFLPLLAYPWKRGRDLEFSNGYGRM